MEATLYAHRARGSPTNAPNASHGDGGASLGVNDKRDIEVGLSGVDHNNNLDLVLRGPGRLTEEKASLVSCGLRLLRPPRNSESSRAGLNLDSTL